MIKNVSIRGFSLLFVLLVVSAQILDLSNRAIADQTPSPWLSAQSPGLIKQFDLAQGASLPPTIAGLGNRDCVNQTVIYRPAKLLQTQQTIDGCFVTTGFGLADSNGWIKFTGTSVTGSSTNFGSYLSGVVPIPASQDVINFTSVGSNGLYLHVTRSLPLPLTVESSLDGKINYRFNRSADVSLRDKSGVLLPAHTDSLAFSSNGQWMIVDSPNRAMLRVNLETMEVIPFAAPFNYNIGISPGAQTAISNDGRYAVVASRNFGVFKIYDLSTCSVVPNTINAPVGCQSRDLLPFIQSQITNYFGVFNLRFVSDDVLTLFGVSNSGGSFQRAKYTMLAPGAEIKPLTYLGMGDSFASGEGDNEGRLFYEPGTDESYNKCHLSRRSYPYLINRALTLEEFHSVACSGAVINDVTVRGQHERSLLSSTLGFWNPGYQLQKNYILSDPSFLTISIGGNDIGFANTVADCATSHFKIPLPTTCKQASDQAERTNSAKLIADQFPRLIQTYKELIAATNQRTKIYVVGYPKFIKGYGGSCGLNVRLNDQEREMIDHGIEYLNQVIKAAAENAGVHYLDIEDALEDKNLCSIVPDNEMVVNGLTEGNDKELPWWGAYIVDDLTGIVGLGSLGIANESYHPNSNGHRLIYEKILGLTGGDPTNFSVCPNSAILCPTNTPIPLPDPTYFGQEAYDYASMFKGVPLPYTIPKPTSPARIIDTNPSQSGTIKTRLEYLLPGSQATIKMDYGQIVVGQAQVGANSVLDTSFNLPNNTPAGVHRLEINTTNIAGEQTTYYEYVFVPGPSGDINDNQIPDDQESCGFVPASGIDSDNDGVDDACDGSLVPGLPRLSLSIGSLSAH